MDLEAQIDSMLATRESRREDWDTLRFQTKAGPEFERAQIRYMGSGGTGNHEGDSKIIAAEHFTFSNMFLPPGAAGPEHTHHDVEEAFFVIEGEIDLTIHDGEATATRRLGYRDFICVPPGVARSLKNNGDSHAIFCVMLGTGKPQIPTYPPTSAMYGITRD
ncbi:MAG: cupin domain-containing protein [Actinomycetota bacterium]